MQRLVEKSPGPVRGPDGGGTGGGIRRANWIRTARALEKRGFAKFVERASWQSWDLAWVTEAGVKAYHDFVLVSGNEI